MAKCAMTYDMPLAEITEQDALNDFMKLKGIRWNEILKDGEWFPRKAAESRYSYEFDGKQQYFSTRKP